ncbi:TPA: type II toxin-antitoxin system RelE/ParE family toxin [Morganella morganii]|uniref:type II toxin-antitoxin system RelE/ParE family toxin n=1 Tax=Morganella morganii TaxID=582 RepID=UPI00298E3500|nr:type II toxin-antitoxin system RelE/ParE family toxin [Morganella morganii]MDW7782632.1 type II toxin-antitoxin system RelE/ParE family toxin [Morganella morganii]MDW7790005.1 type II toxin-antitoxin system RelE/ParE family toxin [Morganella morganii]HCR3230177.1 type II toxin-antitoxin system RelE/ParE family toxin [Morganella morganii]HCR3777856.1 type II toxin-antitoxin system RelE/ParE family toxin [Morganella morganii]
MSEIKIHPDALQELHELPAPQRAKMTRQVDKLSSYSTSLPEPAPQPARDGFFELRIKAGDIDHEIYMYRKGKQIFALKIFAKSTAKLPSSMLTAAARRLEEMLYDE